MPEQHCYHCGDPCGPSPVLYEEKAFCCLGCKTVYEIFSSSGMTQYYEIQPAAGASPTLRNGKFDFMDKPDIVAKLLEFDEGGIQVITLTIPHIHCSSCIWILEHLNRLLEGVISSQVDFPKKTVRISYHNDLLPPKQLVEFLSKIGYEPNISLDDFGKKTTAVDRSLIYKLGIAGFAFGNVMFLSFPEYFEVGEYWLEQYKPLFRWLMFAFSLPVVLYCSQDYYRSAIKGLRSGLLNIDVPIALGITVLFARSSLEIIFDWGSGFFDSLTGLVFFLLLGRFFQQKTYAFLSFERDYKSYFPIAVTRISADKEEETVQVYEIEPGDRLLIRNGELIPVDGILMTSDTQIDYSFVTGEAYPVDKTSGDTVYAGGKHLGGVMEMEAVHAVSQSYLTQLWGNAAFNKETDNSFLTLTNSIGKRFTWGVLSIAAIATTYWLFADPTKALNVFTAVLIIACPCAIALAAPFTLGNLLRILGKRKCYIKDTQTLERMAQLDTAVFDKTGTLTSTQNTGIHYEGLSLSPDEKKILANTLRASNHPLSRSIYQTLDKETVLPLNHYEEIVGKGAQSQIAGLSLRLGSAAFVGIEGQESPTDTSVHLAINQKYKGRFVLKNLYREGIGDLFQYLGQHLEIAILSGDNPGEREHLKALVPPSTPLLFEQKPEDKLHYIESLQKQHKQVMMVGDGLNDAGALAQSDVGLAISENINVFSPACDGILDASKLPQLPHYLELTKKAMTVIKISFILSLLYNVVGLYFAVTAQLEPVIAAILMPLSSITIVAFTTVATNLLGRKLA